MRKKYHIEGIDCANCAAKVEKKMNELPDVEVTLTFATSQLMVDAENPDEVLIELRKIADKMEPGTVIEEISKTTIAVMMIVAMESTMDMNIIITMAKIAAMMIVAVESIKNTSITISTLRVWLRKSIV